jgi:hypothetical protein
LRLVERSNPCELGILYAANKTRLPVEIALTTFYSLSHMVYSNSYNGS